MAVDIIEMPEDYIGFKFVPAEIPPKKHLSKDGKYTNTIIAFLESGEDSVEVDRGEVNLKSAVTSFRHHIKANFYELVRLRTANGVLFLTKE